MIDPRPVAYPPLTAHHRRIFAVAALIGVFAAGGIAFVRFKVILWWLSNCAEASLGCRAAEVAFEWWWVLLITSVGVIAAGAHWLTRDRLNPSA